MSNITYLKIGETEFTGNLTPDTVLPKIELINNAERSLNGTMNIDIIARKINLEVSWSVLSSNSMSSVNGIASSISAFNVTYISPDSSEEKTIIAYVDDFSYTPFFIGNELQWKDITLKFVEI